MCTENQAIMKYDAKSYPIDPNVITLVKNVINLKSLFNPIMNKYGILLKNVMNAAFNLAKLMIVGLSVDPLVPHPHFMLNRFNWALNRV